MYDVDAVVVGAGVVGLAIGRRLAAAGLQTIVLEAKDSFGSETSSRNSEVIHAGIYYPTDSLKARLCVEGRHRLYEYCRQRSVPHRRIGKLICATTVREQSILEAVFEQARRNGVDDIAYLSGRDAANLEPELRCVAALFSPSTGIIDSHAFMLSLVSDLEDFGGRLVCRSRVEQVARLEGDRWAIFILGETGPVLRTSYLVNCAGLDAHAFAAKTEEFPIGSLPPLRLARGVYYDYAGRVPFKRLIYPIPEAAGLGVHLTFDLAGNARFGPNVEWIDEVDYAIADDPQRDGNFAAAARSIYPNVDVNRLTASFAGIRPKLSGPGEPPADFLLLGPTDHGLSNHGALFGIESPGLTASLALADEMCTRLGLEELATV